MALAANVSTAETFYMLLSQELDICDIGVDELVQESWLVEDEFVNESDDNLRNEEDYAFCAW